MTDTPLTKMRIGNVTAAVWKNDSGLYSATLQKSYKDGDEWKNTDYLSHPDLLNAAKVLERAEHYISLLHTATR